MNIIYPSRSAFWRFLLLVSAVIVFRTVYQLLGRVKILGVDLSASPSWLGLITGLGLLGLLALLLFALTWSRYQEQICSLLELPERFPARMSWIGALLLGLALTGFIFIFLIPFVRMFFGSISWMRFLIFWSFSLLGMWGLKLFRRQTSWFVALLAVIFCQATLHLLLLYWMRVTAYPFAMGWSETSRFYYPALFLSEKIYGKEYPWPILHPTLHLLLTPPYFVDAPLWAHRAWRTAISYLLVGAVVPALLKKLSIQNPGTRWLVGLGIFLFLFMLPIYFHLAIPVIILLLGFSREDDRRTWTAVLLASVWCGWSRVNWYPMPGIIAAILYLMEVPVAGKSLWRYLLKPGLWFVVGTLAAFLAQRVYIALSGWPDSSLFYTSFISDLLWYRLWPNSSFSFGILPGIVWTSLPIWIVIYLLLRAHKSDWHPVRLLLIFAAILVTCVGGIIVSLKIGGGANLHNMDAYFVLLWIFAAYLIFARYRSETGKPVQASSVHWLLVLALAYSPVSTYIPFGLGFRTYDADAAQAVLDGLQEHVDTVNAQGGEILFITQRHLISMHMLDGVTLIPEYEREDLMEMAMSNNQPYLAQFQSDMENQRFALIVVDPLNYNILSRSRSFSEENNAWVRRVMKHILCNYREEVVFPADEIALYVPQQAPRQCP